MKRSLGARRFIYPLPVLMVGTYDENGAPDVCNVGWGGICCSEPPCVMLGLHPSRQTLANIQKTQAFTVGIPGASQEVVADYFGCVTAKVTPDKFEKSGLSAVKSEFVDAPVITDFPICMECELVSYEDEHCHCFGEQL